MVAILAVSCVDSSKIGFSDAKLGKATSISLSGIDMTASATVKNETRRNIELQNVELTVLSGGKILAHATLVQPVVVEKRSNGRIDFPIRVRASMSGMLSNILSLLSKSSTLTIDVKAKVKMGGMRKTFRRQFDIPASQIKNMIKT